MCFAPQRRALFRHFFDIWTSKSGPRPSVFNTFDLEMCFAPQRRALFWHLNFQKWSDAEVFCTFWLGNVLRATTACTFSTSQLPKVVRTPGVLYILTWKCASRHNGVHFFDISTSKNGPNPWCFAHFDLEMCFAPQRRALFWRLNFQKCSDHGVFCTFWLGNVLRATTACNCSSLVWPAGSAPAALASLLFDPPEPQIIGKTQCFATFLPFRASICIFFLLTLSLLIFSLLIFLFSLPLPCSAFHLSILSEVWLLNFLRKWQVEFGCSSLEKPVASAFGKNHLQHIRGTLRCRKQSAWLEKTAPFSFWCDALLALWCPCIESSSQSTFGSRTSASIQCAGKLSAPAPTQVHEPSWVT